MMSLLGAGFPYMDVAFIAVIAIFVVVGIFTGFLKSVLSLCGTFGSILISYVLKNPIATLFDKIFHSTEAIGAKVTSTLAGMSADFTEFTSANAGELSTKLSEIECSGVVKTLCGNLIGTENFSSPVSIANVVSSKVGILATTAIAVLVAFILFRIAFFVASIFLNKVVSKYKFTGTVNKILGAVIGIAKGAIVVFCLFAVLSLVAHIPAAADTVNNLMAHSPLCSKGYEFINKIITEKLTTITI